MKWKALFDVSVVTVLVVIAGVLFGYDQRMGAVGFALAAFLMLLFGLANRDVERQRGYVARLRKSNNDLRIELDKAHDLNRQLMKENNT